MTAVVLDTSCYSSLIIVYNSFIFAELLENGATSKFKAAWLIPGISLVGMGEITAMVSGAICPALRQWICPSFDPSVSTEMP